MCVAEASSTSERWLIAQFEVCLLEDAISHAEMDCTLLQLWRDLNTYERRRTVAPAVCHARHPGGGKGWLAVKECHLENFYRKIALAPCLR
jgi:hypothetical protein